jgi:hypothetical protein
VEYSFQIAVLMEQLKKSAKRLLEDELPELWRDLRKELRRELGPNLEST